MASRHVDSEPPRDDVDLTTPASDNRYLGRIGAREKRRKGPGTVARRTLDALAESHRLSKELDDLESYDLDGR